MVNSFADGKTKLVEPPYGSYVDSWQLPVNSNFGVTDASVSGTTTINVASIPISTPFVTLVFQNFDTSPTPWQVPLAGQNLRIVLTGTLAFNIIVYIPANTPGMWIIDNQTSGGFSVTVKTNATSSVGITPFQGAMSFVFCDGTNVYFADIGGAVEAIRKYVPSSVPVGAIMPFAGTTVPNANWLNCNGQAVSRSTYSTLFAYIGTLYGLGDGSTTFNVPNLNQGAFIRGTGGNAAAQGTLQTDDFKSHTHTLTDPGHKHTPANGGNFLYVLGSPNTGPTYYAGGSGDNIGFTSTNTTGITIANTGGTETRPQNFAMLYCIRAL
jgi:microcystin-dependent protein